MALNRLQKTFLPIPCCNTSLYVSLSSVIPTFIFLLVVYKFVQTKILSYYFYYFFNPLSKFHK